ncbi:DNA ligase D-like protein (predicted polymerase) [Friedmanniella endophytica]|uniref:DNA ligase D-like protein (Predicted polymerase) n=1 Tax=Microlunatus kandeliicorticis TaxID=1759536 RepID=A0A7W3ITI9_9ACTN|nr:DNA primase small subunit domain-containing protein [Microlunatus kandeliicorticis]MBA8794890.1 DNA ligase D-like protein (predicted polymerase) [Microlunatus kandeliicorticis]
MPTTAVEVDAGGRAVRVSSPDKVYFPDVGITKLQMIEYVLAVGDGIFAALQDRPVTMERWPGGWSPDAKLSTRADGFGDAFYQKRVPTKGVPQWVESVEITFPSGRTAREVCATELATVVWMANLGTLRYHPWPVKRADPDKVDQLRIDLDPQPGTDFADAAAVAHELRGVLADAGLTGFPKTSGGRGVHVFVPVQPTYGFVEARHAVIALGRELGRRIPDRATINWWKEERGTRIFVDFNQMCRDRTIASAYSIRPTPTAVVSAPLTWDELSEVRPEQFTVQTMPERFADRGDVWAPFYAEPPGTLDAALALYDRDVETMGTGKYGGAEMPYPPDHPKMPGEPSRVQPSRARADNPDFA